MILIALCSTGCTVVGFFSGVHTVNVREREARARPTKAERAACLAEAEGEEGAEDEESEEGEEDDEQDAGCTDRAIRTERLSRLPTGTIAKYTLAGAVIDAVVLTVALSVARASVPSH